jgi:hypothetical protein
LSTTPIKYQAVQDLNLFSGQQMGSGTSSFGKRFEFYGKTVLIGNAQRVNKSAPNPRFEPTGLPSVGLRLKRRSLGGLTATGEREG